MYEEFASVYDQVMDNIPYEKWFTVLQQYLIDHGMEQGCICDLGCGTGVMTELFAAAGYDMIGVDCSEDMLALAQQRREKNQSTVMYLHQDMMELTLMEPVEAMISVCDSMNYLLEEEELQAVLSHVWQQLKPGGYFLFDMKTSYCYQQIMGDQTWVSQDEDTSYIWENYFFEDEQINEYVVTVFKRHADTSLYEKIEEVHHQRAYVPDEVIQMAQRAGFCVKDCLDADTMKPWNEKSARIYYMLQREECQSGGRQ